MAVQAAYIGIGALRRTLDTRTFARIYGELAGRLVVEQRARAVDGSRLAARSTLARELVDFFERDAVVSLNVAYSAAGALVMLAAYDPVLGALGLGLLVPLGLINRGYARRTLALSRGFHDELERQVRVIGDGDAEDVRGHYAALARWRVWLSDCQALNFGLVEVLGLALLAAALLRASAAAGASVGDVLAAFRYAQILTMSLGSLPVLVAQVSRLRDIRRRVFGALGDDGRDATRPPA